MTGDRFDLKTGEVEFYPLPPGYVWDALLRLDYEDSCGFQLWMRPGPSGSRAVGVCADDPLSDNQDESDSATLMMRIDHGRDGFEGAEIQISRDEGRWHPTQARVYLADVIELLRATGFRVEAPYGYKVNAFGDVEAEVSSEKSPDP